MGASVSLETTRHRWPRQIPTPCAHRASTAPTARCSESTPPPGPECPEIPSSTHLLRRHGAVARTPTDCATRSASPPIRGTAACWSAMSDGRLTRRSTYSSREELRLAVLRGPGSVPPYQDTALVPEALHATSRLSLVDLPLSDQPVGGGQWRLVHRVVISGYVPAGLLLRRLRPAEDLVDGRRRERPSQSCARERWLRVGHRGAGGHEAWTQRRPLLRRHPPSTLVRLRYSAGNRAPVPQPVTTVEPATLTARFDGSASYDLDGDPTTYQWDFGDGRSGHRRGREPHLFRPGHLQRHPHRARPARSPQGPRRSRSSRATMRLSCSGAPSRSMPSVTWCRSARRRVTSRTVPSRCPGGWTWFIVTATAVATSIRV